MYSVQSSRDKMPARVARTIKGDAQTSAFDKNKPVNTRVVSRKINNVGSNVTKQENIAQETDLLSLDDPTTLDNNPNYPKVSFSLNYLS